MWYFDFDRTDGAGVVLVANGDWYRNDGDSPEAYDSLQTLFDEARR